MTGTATSTEAIAGAGASLTERRAGRRWIRRAGYAVAVLALVSVSATFFILLGLTSIEPSQEVVVWAVAINGVLLAVLFAAVAYEVVRLLKARGRGEAGARLHIRIVALFALVAVIPAALVAVVANITFAQGADHWFSGPTRQTVESSRRVAELWIETQMVGMGQVIVAMKQDVEARAQQYANDPQGFQAFLDALPPAYGVGGVFLISEAGEAVEAAELSRTLALPGPVPSAVQQAIQTAPQPYLIPPAAVEARPGETKAFVAGLVTLDGFDGLLLYLVAELAPEAVSYMQAAVENSADYEELLAIRSGMQVVFGLNYFGVALMVLAVAIWLGLAVANRLVSPIGRLIRASDSVAKGDLSVQLPVVDSDGELSTLAASFNKMTQQLSAQRSDLVTARDQIDSRRRFIEAVLSGVTAGVIGIDGEGKVTVVNRSAFGLIEDAHRAIVGAPIGQLIPELDPVIAAAAKDNRLEHRTQVTLSRGGKARTINVRVTTERTSAEAGGYVVTLDDVTDLLAAQRTSVWADVARRIAHEIKNPLTPIQLSAERLRRKFGATIESDRAVFDQCVDTIVRQVNDIGRMVDEFSSFARMPKPTLEIVDIREGLRDAVFLMQVGHPAVDITVDLPAEPMIGRFDVRLIAQVITNLVKNGVEAVEALGEPATKGHVEVRGSVDGNCLVIEVIDDGVGLPRENRQMLLEPYMTTREKGTGLGLAIVRKIVEEHAGSIELLDAPAVAEGGHGAMMRLSFPVVTDRRVGAERSSQSSGKGTKVGDYASVAG